MTEIDNMNLDELVIFCENKIKESKELEKKIVKIDKQLEAKRNEKRNS